MPITPVPVFKLSMFLLDPHTKAIQFIVKWSYSQSFAYGSPILNSNEIIYSIDAMEELVVVIDNGNTASNSDHHKH